MAAHRASFATHPLMKNFRLNRLFNPASGRCIDVAVDHGFFNELSFLSGIEDLAKAVEVLVEANPDAIQLTIGQLGVQINDELTGQRPTRAAGIARRLTPPGAECWPALRPRPWSVRPSG